MNPVEVGELLEVIRVYCPSFTMRPATPAVWAHALADIPAAAAFEAVHVHHAVESRWITPADVRRHVARAAGVLPPSSEAAFLQVVAYRGWLSHRRGTPPAVHPAALASARALGWPWLEAPEGVARRRFADVYGERALRDERAALSPGGLPAALAACETARTPKALPAGPAVVDGSDGDVAADVDGSVDTAGQARLRALLSPLTAGMQVPR